MSAVKPNQQSQDGVLTSVASSARNAAPILYSAIRAIEIEYDPAGVCTVLNELLYKLHTYEEYRAESNTFKGEVLHILTSLNSVFAQFGPEMRLLLDPNVPLSTMPFHEANEEWNVYHISIGNNWFSGLGKEGGFHTSASRKYAHMLNEERKNEIVELVNAMGFTPVVHRLEKLHFPEHLLKTRLCTESEQWVQSFSKETEDRCQIIILTNNVNEAGAFENREVAEVIMSAERVGITLHPMPVSDFEYEGGAK